MDNKEKEETVPEKGMKYIFKEKGTRTVLFVAMIIMIMLWVVLNYSVAIHIISVLLGLVMPFIIGVCFAFILNVVMQLFEDNVLTRIENRTKEDGKARPIIAKTKRVTSLIVSLVLVLGIVSFFVLRIIPELKTTVEKIIVQIPSHASDLKQLSADITENLGLNFDIYTIIIDNKAEIGKKVLDFLANGAGDITTAAIDATMSVFSGVAAVGIGFVFAIYILVQKERLIGQCRALTVAFSSEKTTIKIFRTMRLATHVFEGFIKGQFLEACIIFILVLIGTLIIAPTYAVTFAVLLGVCGFVPVIGALLATTLAALILLADDPWKALIFIIYIIVMQQIESNVIYPRVVGHTMSLPGIWVLLAVIAGGAFAGVIGVVVGVPLCALIYSVIRDSVRSRLIGKEMTGEKINKIVKDSFEKIHADVDIRSE